VIDVLGGNRTRVSLIISLILHAVFILVLALYISNVTEKLESYVSISFHKIPSPIRKVRVRKPVILPKPALAPTGEYFPTAEVKRQREMVVAYIRSPMVVSAIIPNMCLRWKEDSSRRGPHTFPLQLQRRSRVSMLSLDLEWKRMLKLS